MRDAKLTQANPQQRTLLRVCRIGRAQGLKGEVNVQVFTDDPTRRFAPGSTLTTDDGHIFIVIRSRQFKNRWIVLFEGVDNRNASEALNGTVLYVEKETSYDNSNDSTELSNERKTDATVDDPYDEYTDEGDREYADESEEGWYLDDLVGLEVLHVDDSASARTLDYDGVDAHRIGVVDSIYNNTAQDILEVRLDSGKTVLVPFVEQIVPIVDIDEGYILIDTPPGLLDL